MSVAMQKCDLIRVLESMGQAVGKRQPTQLELLGTVASLLCDMGRLELEALSDWCYHL